MIKDYKNINVALTCWVMIMIVIRPTHYIFYDYDLDVYHLNKTFRFVVGNFTFQYYIRDLFIGYDPDNDKHFDIAYYLQELAVYAIITIQAYMNVRQYRLEMSIAPHPKLTKSYQNTYWILNIFFGLSAFYLLGYILYKGQFFHGYPLFITIGLVGLILYYNTILAYIIQVKKSLPLYFKAVKNRACKILRKK